MGFALAQAAAEAGAEVTLVARTDGAVDTPSVERIDVGSARPTWRRGARAFAPRCVHRRRGGRRLHAATSRAKLKKDGAPLTLELQPTVDILATVAARPIAPFCVGFAAESHDVERQAEEKRQRKKLPLLIANRAQDALGSDDNEVTLLDDRRASVAARWTSSRSRDDWSRRSRSACRA